MNTSRKMNTSRRLRKKAIPHYFQKNKSSLSDILQTASYKRRIKELSKNNKNLALTVQDAKYTIANQLKQIEEYARTSSQVSYAQLKLKDMASTIQKLVCDLQTVQEHLDFGTKNNFDSIDRRIKIQVPDHSTIEESASMSTLEVDPSLAEDGSPSRSRESMDKSHSPSAVECLRSPAYRDDSITEIYDHNATLLRVGSVAKGGFIKPQEDNSRKNQTLDSNVSVPIQSHPKPQPESSKNKLPGRLEAFLQNYKESPRKPLQALNSGSLAKNTSNAFISKIPKVSISQAPQQQNENSNPVELPSDVARRRDTYVIVNQSSVPDVFASAADRRGTFVINSSEINKLQIDRRGTYVVPPEPVPPIQEESVPITNLTEPATSAESEITNKTILLCEDMELTEVIPTHKPWTDEISQMIPCEKKIENVVPKTSEDVEFTEIISKLPLVNSPFQDAIITVECAVLGENTSTKQNAASTKSYFEDDCFVKPCTSKSSNTSLPVLSNKVSPEQKACDSEDDKTSQKSAVKRKNSHGIEPPEKSKKSRASSMSRRKSVAPKGNEAASDVNSKGANRKSIARTSSRKSVLPKYLEMDFCSDLDDELLSDISISSSSPPCNKRKTRGKKSVKFEKFSEDALFDSVTEPEKDVQVGRRVIDFFETRQSLLPNKRTFVFTSKKVNAKSTVTTQESDYNSKDVEPTKQEEDKCVFEFTASDSEDTNIKSKKTKKRSKKVDSTSQSLKESKKPHLEGVSHQQTEKPPEIAAEHKGKSALKKSESDSSSIKKKSVASVSSETADDSFVIGGKVDEITKMQELVNSKGERIILESSKPSRKSQRRKKTHEIDSNLCQDVLVSSPSELTTPSIVQDNKTSLSPDIYSPVTSSEDSGKNSSDGQSSRSSKVTERSSKMSEGLSSRSSKVSGGRRKVKRTFSGVSERRSKKKSTLDPSDFLNEFNSPITLEEALPKAEQLNSNAFVLDCEMTEVYNLKDIIVAKVQEDKSKYQEQLSGMKQTPQQTKVQENQSEEQVSNEKLTQKQAEVQGDKSKYQEQWPGKKPNQQETKVQEEKSKHKEMSGEKLIQQKAKVQEDKTQSGEKVTQQKAKVLVDKLKKKDNLPGDKLTQQKAKVQEDKSGNTDELLGEKQVEQKAKAQETFPEDKLKNQQQKAWVAKPDALKVETSKNACPEIKVTPSICSKSKESTKEYKKIKASSDKESKCEELSTKSIVPNTETLTIPSSTDSSKGTLANHEQVTKVKTVKHAVISVNKVRNVPPKSDVLCSADVVAPSLQSEKCHGSLKDSNTNHVPSVPEKHKDESTKNSKVTQSVKSKSRPNNEEPSVPSSSTDKNNAAKFNKADFIAMNLDDLTNNDFVPPKTKKLFKEVQNKVDDAPLKEKQPKFNPKKPCTKKSNSKENKSVKIKDSVEAHLNPRASEDEDNHDEVCNLAASSDLIPILRQNCSGSIGSLCNADSKENEGRPSRRNRITKCYKEPNLHSKMRR